MIKLLIISLFINNLSLSFATQNDITSADISQRKTSSLIYLKKNLGPKGTHHPAFVIASPSKAEPDYFFHWVRDAALTMLALMQTIPQSDWNTYLKPFAELEIIHQNDPANLVGLGEVKYNPSGEAFTGPWGRPQNDGPALRVITFGLWALDLLKSKNPSISDIKFLKEKIYRAELPATTLIKKDLEYIATQLENPSFDLWEEVLGQHYFTKMAQLQAMIVGSKLAEELNDPFAATFYTEQAIKLISLIKKHYSSEREYILSNIDPTHDEKNRTKNLDASVIIAWNLWKPITKEIPLINFPFLAQFLATEKKLISKTALKLEEEFKNLYVINQKNPGSSAIGRYPEDVYFGGHPWFITTLALAEFYCHQNNTQNKMSEKELNYISTVHRHMNQSTFQMDEQFSKDHGHMLSAVDLTWSYAAYLTYAKCALQDDLKKLKN